jgi:predicted DNA-binding protein (MmcQ/YjbR family)
MTRDDMLDLCAALPGAVEDNPFGDYSSNTAYVANAATNA